jgi:hypothetical protein
MYLLFPKSDRCSTNVLFDALVEVHIKVFCAVDSESTLPHFSCDISRSVTKLWSWVLSLSKEYDGSIHGFFEESKSANPGFHVCALGGALRSKISEEDNMEIFGAGKDVLLVGSKAELGVLCSAESHNFFSP